VQLVRKPAKKKDGIKMGYPHYNVDLEKYQDEILEWSLQNFGEVPNSQINLRISSFLGVIEEIGELAHAILKSSQGIRTNEDHIAAIEDAIGDLMIFLLDFCARNDLNLDTILRKTWNDVQQRDWKKNKETGQ